MVHFGSGNVPYVQFESVGDFIPEPKCSKFAVGLQTRGSKMGGIRGPVGLWTEGLRVTGAPSGTRWFVGAHNTVDGWMHVVGSTMLF